MTEHADAGSAMRPDIAASWQRVNMAGVDPSAAFETPARVDLDSESALLIGAAPVLEQLEDSLRGSNYSTLLVDRECRVVRRWFDDRRVEESFDALNLRHGASLLEETIGTNALGTVMETRRALAVNGTEHFAESLRRFSCYGHPIRHPLTKRIEGVLDISAMMHEASPLLAPLITRAVTDIEQRLLDGSRTSEKSLLSAFQAATGLHRRPILAIGEDILLSNQSACDLLSPTDLALLRVLAEDAGPRRSQTLDLSLSSGQDVRIEISKVSGARGGAIVRVEPGTQKSSSAIRSAGVASRPGAPAIVAGEPGTGRTTRARELTAQPPTKFLSPAAALLEGAEEWARDFSTAMKRPRGTVCIDGIDLLPDVLLDLVIESVERPSRPHLIFTSGPMDALSGRAATLAGMATVREELLPLAVRRQAIPEIASAMLRASAAHESVHLTPAAIHVLCAQPWPGNLRELNAVIAHAASLRSVGGITVEDLPPQYRAVQTAGPLAALDRAERDVIVMALKSANGNKVKAAQELGLSRTTLYARMRTLRITTY